MAKLNFKNSLIKKLQYRSIYSGSKECDFVLSNFAKNNLEKLSVSELESYERFLTLGDVNIWNWVSNNEVLPFFEKGQHALLFSPSRSIRHAQACLYGYRPSYAAQ